MNKQGHNFVELHGRSIVIRSQVILFERCSNITLCFMTGGKRRDYSCLVVLNQELNDFGEKSGIIRAEPRASVGLVFVFIGNISEMLFAVVCIVY